MGTEDDYSNKLGSIISNLESDRQRALTVANKLNDDAELIDPRFRHKVREIEGQMLKLAIDASIGMAKIMEPIIKNAALSGLQTGRRQLLESLEEFASEKEREDIRNRRDVLDAVEELPMVVEEVNNEDPSVEEEELSADLRKLLAD